MVLACFIGQPRNASAPVLGDQCQRGQDQLSHPVLCGHGSVLQAPVKKEDSPGDLEKAQRLVNIQDKLRINSGFIMDSLWIYHGFTMDLRWIYHVPSSPCLRFGE